jgi:hypothetical protein
MDAKTKKLIEASSMFHSWRKTAKNKDCRYVVTTDNATIETWEFIQLYL